MEEPIFVDVRNRSKERQKSIFKYLKKQKKEFIIIDKKYCFFRTKVMKGLGFAIVRKKEVNRNRYFGWWCTGSYPHYGLLKEKLWVD